MKKKEIEDGGNGGSEGSICADYKQKSKWRKRNEKRLGGKGLSLEAFVNAKSKPSGYNPAVIQKQREFYRNAKLVSKYKRSLRQQSQSSDHLPTASEHEDGCDEENVTNQKTSKKRKNSWQSLREGYEKKENAKKQKRSKNKKNSLQSLREEYEKKRAEEEKARMEREAIIQAKKEEIARAEARRKALREKMFKRTRSGQPVMKYRIEHLLESLVGNSKK